MGSGMSYTDAKCYPGDDVDSKSKAGGTSGSGWNEGEVWCG